MKKIKKMKKIISVLILCTIANLVHSQTLDELGNSIDSDFQNIDINNLRFKSSKKSLSANIINVIPCPNPNTCDLAFDGENLWVASPPNTVYKISPSDGSILKTMPLLNINYVMGLAFDGTNLWLTDRNDGLLIQIDTINGSILQQFVLNNNKADGLAFDNINLWHNSHDLTSTGDTTFCISPISGLTLDYFLPLAPDPIGLTFDGTYLWSSDNHNDQIYKIDLNTYTVLDTIDAPGGAYPNGLTFDGQYLWASNNQSDSIYQIDIGLSLTGLNDFSNESSQIIVYPNPSNGSFTFSKGLNETKCFVEIYNQNGLVVMHKTFEGNSSIVINLDILSPSIYFYTISDNYKIIDSGKLIKE